MARSARATSRACSRRVSCKAAEHALRLGKPEEIPYLKNQERLTFERCGVIDPLSLEDYIAHGGYRGLANALKMQPLDIVTAVTDSGLRGRGGAGFPTGIKWKTVLGCKADQKYIVCNADEGDSGTFADRMLMEGDPFLLIEGMTIAGIAVGATKGFVYIRSEYPHAFAQMQRAIEVATRQGLSRRQRAGQRQGVPPGAAARRRRLYLRRGDLAARQPRRQARHGAAEAAAARHRGPVRQADRDQQRAFFRRRSDDFGQGRRLL